MFHSWWVIGRLVPDTTDHTRTAMSPKASVGLLLTERLECRVNAHFSNTQEHLQKAESNATLGHIVTHKYHD